GAVGPHVGVAVEDLDLARFYRAAPRFVGGGGGVENLDLLVILHGRRDLVEHRFVRRHLDLDVGAGGAFDLLDGRQDRQVVVDPRRFAQRDVQFEQVAPHERRRLVGPLGQVAEVGPVGRIVVVLVVPVVALLDDVDREGSRAVHGTGHRLEGDQPVHDQAYVVLVEGETPRPFADAKSVFGNV